jgi:hypothetical protein
MEGIFSNLNLPKQNSGDETGLNRLPFQMDNDFLNNMMKNMNFQDMFSKMQSNYSSSSADGTASFDKQENSKNIFNSSQNTEQEFTNTDNVIDCDGSKDTKDTNGDFKLNENINNIDFSKLNLGDMDLGNLDINNLLSVFNFENTSKKENIDDELGDYLN